MLVYVGEDLHARLSWCRYVRDALTDANKKHTELSEIISMLNTQYDAEMYKYNALPWYIRLFSFKPTYPSAVMVDGKSTYVEWLNPDRYQIGIKIKKLETMLKAFEDRNVLMVKLSEDDLKLIKY